MKALIDAGVVKNSSKGYVNKDGHQVGFYRTVGAARTRYVQDYYAELASKILYGNS